MKITPMSEAEYNIWAPRSRASYAADKMKASSLTKEEADKIAQADFERLLPEGLKSKDNFLFTLRDEKQNLAGFGWFVVRGPEENRRAFVCDIVVEEAYRGKGYGKQLMLFMEYEAKKMKLKRIGLHVFGFNEKAIGLYRSLGYETTDLVMDKSLSTF
jgi:ribosomal protein S18 acetylase RimI-like enzyme